MQDLSCTGTCCEMEMPLVQVHMLCQKLWRLGLLVWFCQGISAGVLNSKEFWVCQAALNIPVFSYGTQTGAQKGTGHFVRPHLPPDKGHDWRVAPQFRCHWVQSQIPNLTLKFKHELKLSSEGSMETKLLWETAFPVHFYDSVLWSAIVELKLK